MSIKWLRLKRICEEMTNRIVQIHSSTELDDDHIAATEFNEQEATILLNSGRTKSVEMVIKAIAHELTHIQENSNNHNIDFNEKWEKNVEIVTEKYNK
ncbi:MAG: hypothetical protein WC929_00775 [Bacilli bacterium]